MKWFLSVVFLLALYTAHARGRELTALRLEVASLLQRLAAAQGMEKRARYAEDVLAVVESLGAREAAAVASARKLLEIPDEWKKP